MTSLYARWMEGWETRLATRDNNRVVRPFEWGLDWLGIDGTGDVAADPGGALAKYAASAIRDSDEFYRHTSPPESWLDGETLSFASGVCSPFAENNTVYAEYFPAPNAGGRAVLVIPQWNSDAQSHIKFCRILQRWGISALRFSPAYHHRRMPPELQRADYHVSANLGRTIHATRQSVQDARCCLDWLEARGHTRLGILGSSLGSCIALLAVAHEERIRVAVFNHVSMNFSDVVWTGISCRHIRQSLEGHVTQEEMRRYWSVISPSAYIGRLAGRDLKSLLIWCRHDTTFRPEYSIQALKAFRDHKLWHQEFSLGCGHYTLAKFPFSFLDGWAMAQFLYEML